MSFFLNQKIESFADVEQALRQIQETLNNPLPKMSFDTQYAVPLKPREGDVVKADGVTWNPGSGPGLYLYRGGAWRFLG